MKIAGVDVDHFLCFRQLELSFDRSFQVVAGPNNSGKSSLVRLIQAFFSDPTGSDLAALLPVHPYYQEMGARTLSNVRVWFGDLYEDDQAGCEAAVRRDGLVWVAVRCSKAGNISYQASRNVSKGRAREIYEYVLGQHHFVKIPSVRVGSPGDVDRPASLERLIDTLESTLIRTGPARSTSDQLEFSRKGEEVEKLVKQLLDASADSIHAELPFQGGEVRFRLPEFRYALRGLLDAVQIESGEQAVVPISQRGTGFQSALVLGILKYVAEREASGNVVFAIEEPEAFLHPQTQRAMTAIISGISKSAQVLLTTHSPVVTDSVDIAKIARLPLQHEGTVFKWAPATLSEREEGRLSRYCTASNSELIFANAVIFVEGEGDEDVIELLLDRICASPGSYFARGVTVVSASGLGKIKYLVQLAERFGVRSYVLADKDGLKKRNESRQLLDALSGRATRPDDEARAQLISRADRGCASYAEALSAQDDLNQLLEPFDAFVLSSDLEGLLVDALGVDHVLEVLGPSGEGELHATFVGQVVAAQDRRGRLSRKLGSKGWDGNQKGTGKMAPHLPRIVLRRFFEARPVVPDEVAKLERWLETILAATSPPAV